MNISMPMRFAALLLLLAVSPIMAKKTHLPPPPPETTLKTTTEIHTTSTAKSTTSVPPETTSTTSAPPETTTSKRTTAAPPTTTAAPIPPPTPLPPADTGLWMYSDPATNHTCIIVKMAAQINVTYENKDLVTMYSSFNLPNTTKVIDGDCGNRTQFILLQWPVVDNLTNSLKLVFTENDTIASSPKYSLTSMQFTIVQDVGHFPNVSDKDVNRTLVLTHSGDTFTTPLTMSYLCSTPSDVLLESSGNPNSTVVLKDLQIQAFHTEKGHAFGNANDCKYVDVPDIVPIAVGCALGGLVLIVLIAYLIGRHRRHAQGYLSM